MVTFGDIELFLLGSITATGSTRLSSLNKRVEFIPRMLFLSYMLLLGVSKAGRCCIEESISSGSLN